MTGPVERFRHHCRRRILGRNWDKSLKSFRLCYSQSPILTDFTTPLPWPKSGLKLVCIVNIICGNVKSDNSQDYAQKPQQNCTFMNSTSGEVTLDRLKRLQYLMTGHAAVYILYTHCKEKALERIIVNIFKILPTLDSLCMKNDTWNI